ncbi:MAG: hypothetical protein JWQ20_1402, partial [Conexibacter sp.]|nr:hypothetical protein [Conexibacter sp.]
PQDVDWYRFYAKPQSQVGVLATLAGPCNITSGSITVYVYDADGGGYALPLVNITVGYSPVSSSSPTTAAQGAFTSEAGHRYFIKLRQSLCQNVGYTLQLAPGEDLTHTLQDTLPCTKARATASAARHKLYALRAAAKKAHGARRRNLRSRAALQQQQVVVATATTTSSCTRRPLDSYPFT